MSAVAVIVNLGMYAVALILIFHQKCHIEVFDIIFKITTHTTGRKYMYKQNSRHHIKHNNTYKEQDDLVLHFSTAITFQIVQLF